MEEARRIDLSEAYRRVGEMLDEQLDDIVAELTDLFREELPKYDAVPRESIERDVRGTIELSIAPLRQGKRLDASTAAGMSALAKQWVNTELPHSSIARSHQMGAYHLLGRVRGAIRALDLDREVADAAEDEFWQWSILAASSLADAERDQAMGEARRDEQRRGSFLRGLAGGTLSPAELRKEAELHGLDLDLVYVPVVASRADSEDLGELERAVRASATTEHRAVQTSDGGRVLAVAPQTPDPPEGATLAIGPARKLADISGSFNEAHEVHSTARRFGLTGVVDLVELGPLAVIGLGGELAQRFSDRYFATADESFLEIERTVLAFLERDQSTEELAAAMHLHRNTVRYRVRGFEETTGLDIRRTRDLVTAWWLLTWREQQRRVARDAS